MRRNTLDGYSSTSKALHWIVAIAIYIMIPIGFIQINIDNDATATRFFNFHETLGILILGVMVLRLSWRWMNITPAVNHLPRWQRIASRTVHILLYTLLFCMPLTGWIKSTASGYTAMMFGEYPFPMPGIHADKSLAKFAGALHELFAFCLIALVLLHIAAALKHYFINKDQVLQRMLTEPKTSQAPSPTHIEANTKNA